MTAGDSEVLSRKRTADMLRRLRMLTQQLKMLKHSVDEAAQAERLLRGPRVRQRR